MLVGIARRLAPALAVATASLAVVGSAQAAVQVVSPDNTTTHTDNLGAAMINAYNQGGSQTIILQTGSVPTNWVPQGKISNTPPNTIGNYGLPPVKSGEKLTIIANHASTQAGVNNSANIDGSQADTASGQDLFTVQSGGTLTIEGVEIGAANQTALTTGNDNGIHVLGGGTLNLYGDLIANEKGLAAVNVEEQGVANIYDSSFNADSQYSIYNVGNGNSVGGKVVLSNSDVIGGLSFGLGMPATGNNMILSNDIIYNNGDGLSSFDCNVQPSTAPDATVSGDGTCTRGAATPITFGTFQNYGGPTELWPDPHVGPGDPAKCDSVDQRFYVIPVSAGARKCDIGSETDTAQKATATSPAPSGQITDAPACTVAGQSGNGAANSTQTVNAADNGSGLGFEPGVPADSTTGSVLIAGTGANNPSNTANVNPADAVSNAVTTDGSVSVLNPFTSITVSSPPLQVQAQKDGNPHVAGDTHWAFDVTNWAGITTYCH